MSYLEKLNLILLKTVQINLWLKDILYDMAFKIIDIKFVSGLWGKDIF